MTKETGRWVRKAEADMRMARALRSEKPPLHDGVCFHCQQAAEKYVKAFLQEVGVAVPRTHDLEKLQQLAASHDSKLKILLRGLRFLTIFAVDVRYPDADATLRQAKSAIRWAELVRKEIRIRLRLRR